MVSAPMKPSAAITFGIIVLNGEPFTRFCLRSLYPFAHQIIVVEGAVTAAANQASEDGRSLDGTVQSIKDFQANEDPDNKVLLIQKLGYWEEKDQQSQAFADAATGEYLWQVDIDEFYKPEDISRVVSLLESEPDIASVSFKQLTFWGSPHYIVDGWYLQMGNDEYHRLFRWGPGYRYVTHRPPTVIGPRAGETASARRIRGADLARSGVFLYHYSLLFPGQVRAKCGYYAARPEFHRPEACAWAEKAYMKLEQPFRVHNVYSKPSWLARYAGEHPPEIENMMQFVRRGESAIELRQTDDVERLLKSPRYVVGRFALRTSGHLRARLLPSWRSARSGMKNLLSAPS